MSSRLDIPPGRVIGGEFRVLAPLAEGGMGAVYVAEQLSTGKRRALKLMHLQIASDQASRDRFVREAQIGSRIESEHVVEVILAGIDAESGVPWLAMELLEGASLARIVQERGAMSPPDVARVYKQVGHALSAAHRVGVVHRDLKPDNVFVASAKRSDTPFTVKILDFGIAKLVASATSAHNSQLIGSPLWMAPEQLQTNAPIGPATDVWALGLIAFHLLTGRFYWLAANAADVGIHSLITEMVVSPVVRASDRAAALGASDVLPDGFDEWFARTTVRDPSARWSSVDEVVASLIGILERAPLAARQVGAVQPLLGAAASDPTAAAAPVVRARASGPTALGATMVAPSAAAQGAQPLGAQGPSATAQPAVARVSVPTSLAGSTAPMGGADRGPTRDERARAVVAQAPDRTPAPIARTGPVAEPRRGGAGLWVAGAVVALLGVAATAGAIYVATRGDDPREPVVRAGHASASHAPGELLSTARVTDAGELAHAPTEVPPEAVPVPDPEPAALAVDAGVEVVSATEGDASTGEPRAVEPANTNARRAATTVIGRPQNAGEHALLIESLRQRGDSAGARREMQRFVAQYPSHPRANTYRQMLGAGSAPAYRPAPASLPAPRPVRIVPPRPVARPIAPRRTGAEVPPNPF